ncbi:hypothetical protein ABNX05_02385 [Lysinibacillus sp. M3]|uniref:Uncharacterized protein n=1 Tax=Lysinibacillus zambalensis TaxID=3160866 RepID=A0ABV1MLS0_9BACI
MGSKKAFTEIFEENYHSIKGHLLVLNDFIVTSTSTYSAIVPKIKRLYFTPSANVDGVMRFLASKLNNGSSQ